jgi:hypothetical protein
VNTAPGHTRAAGSASCLGRGGFTVADVAARFRVSPDKVRLWIKKGELAVVNTASSPCGRPQLPVTAEGLAAFERLRSATPPPKPPRRRQRPAAIDYYPD